jgi:hypothetical protein
LDLILFAPTKGEKKLTFQNLSLIIGPAPSELPNEELLAKLAAERDRVRRTFVWYRNENQTKVKAKVPKVKAPAASSRGKALLAQAKALGLSVEDIEKTIAALKSSKGA